MRRLLCALSQHRTGPMVDRKARCRCGRSWEFHLADPVPEYQSFDLHLTAPPAPVPCTQETPQ